MSTTTTMLSEEEVKKLEKEEYDLFEQISELRKKRLQVMYKLSEMDVSDYTFKDHDGKEFKLSEFFGDQKYLFLIHNMGKSCSYCSMWADGFNDTFRQIQKKGAFVLISPDSPEVQKDFAASRGWKFPMYSSEGNTFTLDVGYAKVKDGKTYYHPGISVFEKTTDGKIKRISKDWFGPTDFYCNIWHVLDLLPEENITIES
jgi:predicted dithiol-disulfide oxidoreductase (DUF899 family)